MTIASRLLAHAAAVPAPSDGHAALYETCAALIVAVMVVIYFDERVRKGLTARMRGYAIGSVGGILGVGLLAPLFELASFMPDTRAIRMFCVAYTLVFMVMAFGAAIHIWGTEDGRRLRSAQLTPALPPVPPLPRGGQTERERACEVLAAVLANLSHVHPLAITANIARIGVQAQAQRHRDLTAQLIALQPYLVAVSASYPSAEVRERLSEFAEAARIAMEQAAAPFANEETLASQQAADQWQASAGEAFEDLERKYEAVVTALHRETRNGHRPTERAKPHLKPASRQSAPAVPNGEAGGSAPI